MTFATNTITENQPSPYIKEVGVQNFMAEVVQASLQVPVLVYFTATWCQPCKQYGPLLEKVVNEAKGRVKLARVDIDKNPPLAQQFRIQSVPMVYVFFQGQPLDAFAGAMPESQLKQLIEQVAGAGPEGAMIKETLESAEQFLAEGNPEQAQQAYLAILEGDEGNVEALVGVARCLMLQEQLDEAQQWLTKVPPEKQSVESVIAAKAALVLAQSAPKAADLSALEKASRSNPQDHQARFDYAVALFSSGKQEEAVTELLAVIAKQRDWNEGAARAQLLTFFEALGFAHPVAAQGRRKLSSILFA